MNEKFQSALRRFDEENAADPNLVDGRPRELHVEKAVAIADLTVHPGAAPPGEAVRCRYFVTESVALAAGEESRPEPERCHLWIVVEGQGTVGGQAFRPGEVWLLPDRSVIRAETGARFLRTYVPADMPGRV